MQIRVSYKHSLMKERVKRVKTFQLSRCAIANHQRAVKSVPHEVRYPRSVSPVENHSLEYVSRGRPVERSSNAVEKNTGQHRNQVPSCGVTSQVVSRIEGELIVMFVSSQVT